MNKLTKGSNMRWESSRMILPEWKEAYLQHLHDQKKIDRPILSADDLSEIQETLLTVIKSREFVDISYFKDGYIKHKICTVAKLDQFERIAHIHDGFGMAYRIPFMDVMDVHFAEQDGV